ncbi:hormogonium polysaccharide biosynthesis protein HpsA [Argonema galeatum]|uniref:hormogonium polysaccharide biosynthesis protein HpsA n=1 Tax=Argonema galeatum TaxID=2942762 RepID=UPI002011C3A9|nr:hormogonium polysaccharide biosynthesis protein HpsA [Argonema galeatum]MCL1464467.1 hormogonium polysaccharide biosynthesis protein HpsA [Argonema galeatum A003/A1]
MLNRKQTKAIKKFIYTIFKQFWQLSRSTSRKLSRWLVRNLLNIGRRRRMATARSGFVLPTVVMLLLVVALVVAALLFRTGSRTNQVIGAREEQVIYNAATPAIERAKAKLEYLFRKDKRFPSGPPSDEMLLSMLTNEPAQYSNPALTTQLNPNPYKLNDETELGNINPNIDGKPDPAWSYKIDVDGDGNPETVVYSITLKRRETAGSITLENSTDQQKANSLVVRNGPINSRITTDPVCAALTATPAPPAGGAVPVRATNENDWFPQGSATLRKTFQVDAIVISNKAGTSRTVATLEFQQDRQIDRGNKWGAWFRYDLEIFPSASGRMQWNGAMYTAGNLMIGNGANFTSYLISAPKSCFYRKDASEIRINQNLPTTPTALNPRFMGQIVAGQIEGDAFNGSASLHVMKPDNSPNTNAGQTTLDQAKDSVNSGTPSSIALDPVVLFTTSTSQSRGSDPTNTSASLNDTSFDRTDAAAGQIGYFSTTERIVRRTETPPFIDDTYRADDRYGPKPAYGTNNEVVLDSGSKRNGQNIQTGDQQLLTNNTVDPLDTEFRTLGWDGYWERRASLAGLRVIVGERLELGNPYGWTSNDPLYPPDQTMPHGDRQRRTLRDNLAAVQATAVYHVANPSGANVPIACLATTSHPGTQATIDLSKDFRTTNGQLNTNFFTGKGTNGWEYAPPPTGLGGSWDTALRNLASFAGEIDGAFPPRQEGGRIHPNPFLTMWGNFSNLRRAIESGNNSIADNTYKYTAACTMGMLAQNINRIQTSTISTAVQVQQLSDALPTTLTATATASDYIAAMPSTTDPEKERKERLRLIHLQNQIKRDREFGFALVPQTILDDANHSYSVQYLTSENPQPGGTETPYTFAGITYDKNVAAETATTKKTLKLSCNYREAAPNGNNYFGLGAPTNVTEEKRFIRLAVSLCSSTQLPELPSLYYLFPTAAHGRNSVDATVNSNEPYIRQTNDAGISVIGGNFIPLNPSDILEVTPIDNVGSWRLPHTTDATGRTSRTQITKPDNSPEYVSLIDTSFYNGREMMTVRTLDVDLNLLRSTSINGNTWLPTSGIVYAFREDAAREDAISRPGAGAGSCSTNAQITTGGCQMRAIPIANNPQDPAVSANGVSPKPVDYYADPDRRPHGFRLFNGRDISRSGNKGLSFISDNPVYIQGDFNFHSTDGNTNNLEEFTQRLDDNTWTPANFYTDRTTLDANFARPATDHWRPSEILGDAVTILSNSFKEGNIADGITNSGTPATHSFRAMNGPNSGRANNTWVREDGTTSSVNLPIKVSRNGNPLYCGAGSVTGICTNPTEETSFRPLDTDYAILANPIVLNTATPTRVNAMIISGITPSGQGLSYGGFQNFPRYIENWLNVNQVISGSFMQLNFSTYATAPFRQNAWEPGTTANGGFPKYYSAPLRRWGYDVGLQYAPAAPVAQRLGSQPSSRSEFYKDLRADDLYICKLRRAMNRLDPTLDQPSLTECD